MPYKNNRIDYAKKYHSLNISAQTLKVLIGGDRKEDYFMNVLKRDRYKKDKNGRCIRDENGQPIMLPEREVSLDKLLGENWEFPSSGQSPEQSIIAEIAKEELHSCIRALPKNERDVIYALFFSFNGEGMTVREYAELSGIAHTTIQSRKQKALARLKEMLTKT